MRQLVVSENDLQQRRERNQQLRRLAAREMTLLENLLAPAGRMMLLADAAGVILDSSGDVDFLGRASRDSLLPGASWEEGIAGTNGVGTALAEGRFIQVTGSQHFFADNRALTCTAMPIHTPAGLLAGVLDITGRACEAADSAARLVRHAVAHIEHRWTAESATDLVVHVHRHPSWLGTPDEGLLLFHDGLLTGANARARDLLALSASTIRSATWDDLFEGRPRPGMQELQPLSGDSPLFASITTVRHG
jgi:sigma-54 dependent transcriptional regulator, acetoin dehydrogenase operon transcriptional activator AcoR